MDSPIDLKAADDIELLEYLCSSDDNSAYKELVTRFHKELKSECETICKKRSLDVHIGRQIANQTFERARKYHSFKRRKINYDNPHKAVLAYLIRISKNLFYDFHNAQKPKPTNLSFYFDDIIGEIGIEDRKDLQYKRDTSELILKSLSKREQLVVVTDLENKRFQKYLPTDVTEKLAYDMGVKKATVRKIRERAKHKLIQAINAFTKE